MERLTRIWRQMRKQISNLNCREEDMSTEILSLRCFAELKDGYWQAFCIDLGLAVQADTCEEVQQKLHAQVNDYLKDIFEGEDRPYAAQLLLRKSPWQIRARYHRYQLQYKLVKAFRSWRNVRKNGGSSGRRFIFTEVPNFRMA